MERFGEALFNTLVTMLPLVSCICIFVPSTVTASLSVSWGLWQLLPCVAFHKCLDGWRGT